MIVKIDINSNVSSEDLSVFPMNPMFCIKSCPFFQRVHHSPENRMSANQAAKRDVVVSKDALLKSYRKRLKVRIIQERNIHPRNPHISHKRENSSV